MSAIATLRQSARAGLESESSALDVDLLLAHVLGKTRTYLYTWPEVELDQSQLARFEQLLEQRKTGVPIAHLIGEREFWGLNFSCNNASLIPRPDTETLVEKALELLPETPLLGADFGTGTGAIACALASERPSWQILALDRVFAACQLAQANRQGLGFDNISVLQASWGQALKPLSLDFIVSNPPYIDGNDPHLLEGDVRFEPASALVADKQGYGDIERIIAMAESLLKPGAYLLFEHGYRQAEGVQALFDNGRWCQIASGSDLAGNPRITWAAKI